MGKKPQNKWKKAWDYMSHQFQGFLTFCRVRVEKVRTKPKNNAKSLNNYGKNNETCTKQWEKTRKNIWKKAGNCISQHCSAVLNLELISRFPDFLQGLCERSEDDKPHQRLWLKIYENLAKQLEKHGEWH